MISSNADGQKCCHEHWNGSLIWKSTICISSSVSTREYPIFLEETPLSRCSSKRIIRTIDDSTVIPASLRIGNEIEAGVCIGGDVSVIVSLHHDSRLLG